MIATNISLHPVYMRERFFSILLVHTYVCWRIFLSIHTSIYSRRWIIPGREDEVAEVRWWCFPAGEINSYRIRWDRERNSRIHEFPETGGAYITFPKTVLRAIPLARNWLPKHPRSRFPCKPGAKLRWSVHSGSFVSFTCFSNRGYFRWERNCLLSGLFHASDTEKWTMTFDSDASGRDCWEIKMTSLSKVKLLFAT